MSMEEFFNIVASNAFSRLIVVYLKIDKIEYKLREEPYLPKLLVNIFYQN